ncbi:MAG TPA: hypothetical protein VEA19_01950 [Actinomycetota bacterium]|nr:hypothetical protein [Actinomycetota bacterium]
MIRFLRNMAPRNPFAAVLYWVVLVAVTLSLLFVAFYFLDDYLPGAGQF